MCPRSTSRRALTSQGHSCDVPGNVNALKTKTPSSWCCCNGKQDGNIVKKMMGLKQWLPWFSVALYIRACFKPHMHIGNKMLFSYFCSFLVPNNWWDNPWTTCFPIPFSHHINELRPDIWLWIQDMGAMFQTIPHSHLLIVNASICYWSEFHFNLP